MDTDFDGVHYTNLMNITHVECIPDEIDLHLQVIDQMSQLHFTFGNPYLVMLYECKQISRPTFAFISPGATFNVASVRAHILDPLNLESNYFNDCKVKIPV